MKLLNKFKWSLRKAAVVSALAATIAGVGILSTSIAGAAGCVSQTGDPSNDVVCGGGTASQLVSKYNNGDGRNSASSIQHIYTCMGISKSDIGDVKADGVSGTVTKSGDVLVNGKVVATGAETGGRQLRGSSSQNHKMNCQGTTFYERAPSVNFLSNSLPAVIVMKNGVFQFAIINSCGNPVKAVPTAKPGYEINKLVSVSGTHDYDKNVTVAPGTKVFYKVTVTNTGNTDLKNVLVNDDLPAHVQYVNNTLTRDGNKVSNDSAFFGKGITINLSKGETDTFIFQAIVGPNVKPETCTNHTLDNEAEIHESGLPGKNSHATVNEKCQQTVACTSLNATSSDNVTFNFTAKAQTTHGATITGYLFKFGDGVSKTVNGSTTSHTYAKSGTFTASVTVLATVNGKSVQVTGPNCQTVVKPKITPPTFACDSLTPTENTRTSFTFTTKAHASGGASIVGYNYNFGDGHSVTGAGATVSHTYTAAGTYHISAAIQVKINGKVQPPLNSAACETTVNVKPAPAAECTGLTAQIGDNQNVTATAAYTVTNATLTSASFNWGDGTAATPGTNDAAASKVSASHTYSTTGNFNIVATLKFTTTAGQTLSDTCQTPVNFQAQPTFTCDNLTVSTDSNRNATITGFNTTATNGAVFSQADIDWGDSTGVTTTSAVVGQQHQYDTSVTTATITVTAHFTVNGEDVTASGPNCVKQVSFTTPPCICTTTSEGTTSCTPSSPNVPSSTCTTPTPPSTPTTLVNTGPGSVAAIFAGASVLGTVIYRQILRRRLTQ